MNPLKSTYNTKYAETFCCYISCTLLNHLVIQLYSKCRNLEIEFESIFATCLKDTADQPHDTAKQMRHRNYVTYIYGKNRKLEKLNITTSSNQASASTTVETGIFLATMDVSAFYTSIRHDASIDVTASLLNINNCKFPDAILQLICFILVQNVFTFNNQLFIQTHGTAVVTKFAPQYTNIFMHNVEPDSFATQDLQLTLYTRYINDIFFLGLM
eukprot:g39622.t1